MIEYRNEKNICISVILDGQIVGHIQKVSKFDGKGDMNEFYRYLPKGYVHGGILYSTLEKCKQSIEEN